MKNELINLGISEDSIDNIIEVYGEEFLESIDDISYLKENFLLFEKYELDYDEVFAIYPMLFLETPTEVKERLGRLIKTLGVDYQNLLEEDLTLYEKIVF